MKACLIALALVAGATASIAPEDIFTGLQKNSPLRGAAGHSVGSASTGALPGHGEVGAFDPVTRWTPWYDADDQSGNGDYEMFNHLNQQHNLCGRMNVQTSEQGDATTLDGWLYGGGAANAPELVECRVKGTTMTSAQAGQTVSCSTSTGACVGGAAGECDSQTNSVGCMLATCTGGENAGCSGHNEAHCTWNVDAGFSCNNADNQACIANYNDATLSLSTDEIAACTAAANADSCLSLGPAGQENCKWGCLEYETRFKCTDNTEQQEAPTPSPTTWPTNAPTLAPTKFPTPAPSPRGTFASQGIELIPSVNRIEGHDLQSCADAMEHNWQHNENVNTVCAADDASVTVEAAQATGTPGIITTLDSSDQEAGSDIAPDTWYVVIVKGSAANGAWPFLRCADVAGNRANVLWRTGTAAKANSLPTADGYSISFLKEPTYYKDCQFGVLFDSPTQGDQMVIDYTEVRPAQGSEIRDLAVEFGHSPNSDESTFPEHLEGRISNYNFMLGLAGWRTNSPSSSRMWSRVVTPYSAYGFATQGAVVAVTGTAPVGLQNGIVQRELTVVQGQSYRLTAKGQFVPAAGAPSTDRALVWVGDSSGELTTNFVWTNEAVSLSKIGVSTTDVVFTAPSTRINIGVLMDGSNAIGSELHIQTLRLEPYTPPGVCSGGNGASACLTKLDEATCTATACVGGTALGCSGADFCQWSLVSDQADQTRTAGTTCACDPAQHPSKVTRCHFDISTDGKRHHILKVTHQKEHMGNADFHRCADVSENSTPLCKCCDCNGGAVHAPAFDMTTLEDASSFIVQFNNFAVDSTAMEVKPGMTGMCRYSTVDVIDRWCCQATAGNSGKEYGDEVCTDACGADCISFWGRQYTFSHNHGTHAVFQNLHHAVNDDTLTVTTVNTAVSL